MFFKIPNKQWNESLLTIIMYIYLHAKYCKKVATYFLPENNASHIIRALWECWLQLWELLTAQDVFKTVVEKGEWERERR